MIEIMKKQKNLFFAVLFICLLQSVIAAAQVQTPRYISMVPHTNAYYEYLPQGYPEPNKKYPLMIFFHGLGETGPGTAATLPYVLRNGPPKLINEGSFPTSFTVNNVNHKFIVISPQFTDWPTETDADNIINYLIANYPVDINRIYLTGLSMGGGVVWNYSGNDISHANRIAGIVPVCGAGYPYPSHAQTMAAANLPVWATHNSLDNVSPPYYTIDYINLINGSSTPPSPLAKKTIFEVPTANHDAWTRTYDPAFKENGVNVYEWMLQNRRFLTVLPVTGLSFNAATATGNKVILQWSTVSEINNPAFTIQRSEDGIHFNDLAVVNSTATNGAGAQYSYIDNSPLAGTSYYRLQMQEPGASKTYSSIKSIQTAPGSVIRIFPNPVRDKLNISIHRSFVNSTLQINNVNGQLVQTEFLNGNGTISVNVAKLPAGIYYAAIINKTGKQQFRFVKR
jgi:dienelactone hydrolase